MECRQVGFLEIDVENKKNQKTIQPISEEKSKIHN